jgi:hypothetical protein
MAGTTERIVRTWDNFADYFPFDFPGSLVAGLKFREGGIGPEDPLVTLFRAWLDAQADRPPGRDFDLRPSEAAIILEHLAGWRDD